MRRPAGRRHHLHADAPARGRGGRAHRGACAPASRPCASPRAAPTPSAARSAPPAPTPGATTCWSAATTAGTTGTSAPPPATGACPAPSRQLTATFPYGDRESLELVLDRPPRPGGRGGPRALGGHRARARLPPGGGRRRPPPRRPVRLRRDHHRLPPGARRRRRALRRDPRPGLLRQGPGQRHAHRRPSAGRWEHMAVFEEIFFSGTHGGEALSLAAARAVLDTLADGTVLADIEALGRRMLDGIAELIAAHGVADRVTVGGEPQRAVVGFPGDDHAGGQELGAADAGRARRAVQRLDVHLRPPHRGRHRPGPGRLRPAFAALAGGADGRPPPEGPRRPARLPHPVTRRGAGPEDPGHRGRLHRRPPRRQPGGGRSAR